MAVGCMAAVATEGGTWAAMPGVGRAAAVHREARVGWAGGRAVMSAVERWVVPRAAGHASRSRRSRCRAGTR